MTASKAQRVDVLIVGGGFGGMYATYKFREMGYEIQSFEAGGGLGGVWYWNRYPCLLYTSTLPTTSRV